MQRLSRSGRVQHDPTIDTTAATLTLLVGGLENVAIVGGLFVATLRSIYNQVP